MFESFISLGSVTDCGENHLFQERAGGEHCQMQEAAEERKKSKWRIGDRGAWVPTPALPHSYISLPGHTTSSPATESTGEPGWTHQAQRNQGK